MVCKNCQGSLEPIQRLGQQVFLFCRACKLSHDASGRPMISSPELRSDFNPLKIARATIGSAHPTMAPVGRSALEVALVQALQESYFNGLRDGVLLAYSQEYKSGEPHEPVQSPTNNSGEGKGAV